MYNGHVCCSLPYSPSPSPPCFSCHKLGNRQEVRRGSSAANLAGAGCSRAMQIRLCFLFCPEWTPWMAGLPTSPGSRAAARCPGHHSSSWLTPGEAKCPRMILPWHRASLPGPALLPPLPSHSCPSGGHWPDPTFTECFKFGGEPDWGTAQSTEAIPPGPSQASPPAWMMVGMNGRPASYSS